MSYSAKSISFLFSADTNILDQDDINGPSSCHFEQETGDLSVDFALFRIQKYSSLASVSEKVGFTKHLSEIAEQLDGSNMGRLMSLIRQQVSDHVDIRVELSSQLPLIASVISEKVPSKLQEWVLPVFDSLLATDSLEVIQGACMASPKLIKLFSEEERPGLVTLVLRIIHDEREHFRLIGLKTLQGLAPFLSAEVCIYFLAPDLTALCLETTTEVKKSVPGLLPKLCKAVNDPAFTQKMLDLFANLLKEPAVDVRKACAFALPDFFMFEPSEVLHDHLNSLLNDKSNSVRQSTKSKLGVILASTTVEFDLSVFDNYLSLCKSSHNEMQHACAFYLPGILHTRGDAIWGYVGESYVHLCKSGSLRSQKSLASSMHEVAAVLGPELSSAELLPLYQLMINRSHPARIQALVHLSAFCKCLTVESRFSMIDVIKQFAVERQNWRVRNIVALQMPELIEMFGDEVLAEEFWGLILSLCRDEYAKVRENAATALGFAIQRLPDRDQELLVFFNSTHHSRMVFVIALSQLSSEVTEKFKEQCQVLCNDPVPNIRIRVAQLVKKTCKVNPAWNELSLILKADRDEDVKYTLNDRYNKIRGVRVLKPGLHNFGIPPPLNVQSFDFESENLMTFTSSLPQVFEAINQGTDENLFNATMEDILLTSN